MNNDKLLTVLVVFILMFSGVSVVVQSVDAAQRENDNIKKDTDKRTDEDDGNRELDHHRNFFGSIDKDYLGLSEEKINSHRGRVSGFVKSIELHDLRYLRPSFNDVTENLVIEGLEETSRSIDVIREDSETRKRCISGQPRQIETDCVDPHLHTLRDDTKRSIYPRSSFIKRSNINEIEDVSKITYNLERTNTISQYYRELIIDRYDITFQDNMTALSVDSTFSIYRVEVEGNIYTAEDIRDAENTSEMMDSISDRMGDVFNETIFSAFPDEKKDVHETTYDIGTSPEPINISCSADVYLRRSSFGFDEDNEELDLSDVIKGTMKMGASISKNVSLRVKPGHNTTYSFKVPLPFLMGSDDTYGAWGGSNRTWDDHDNRTSTVVFNNTGGNNEVVLSKELNVSHQSPVDINRESINGTSIFDMNSFEDVDIKDIFNVSSVNISDYKKPGTDEPILPSNISGLDIISSDGLRMMLDNNLTDLQEIKDQSIDTSIKEIKTSIKDLFGEEPVMKFEWDPSTVTGYDVDAMGTTPPFRGYLNSTEPVGFTNKKLDLPQEADIDELVTEALKLDAYVIQDFNMSVEEGMYLILKIRSPENVKFEGSTPINNDRYLYRKDIDNREGDNALTDLTLNISWGGEVRIYDEEDIGSDTLIDMIDFDNIPVQISMEVRSVRVDRYGDGFDIPDPINDLEFIDGNFIRAAVRNGLVELSTIYNESVHPAREDITAGLSALFGEDLTMEFSWESLEWKEWTPSEWESYSPDLGAFKGYLYTIEPAAFTTTSLGLPEGADVGELVREVLKLDTSLTTEFPLTVSENRWLDLSIKTPEKIGIKGGVNESGRWNRTWHKEAGDHIFPVALYWAGPGMRIYDEEDIGSSSIIDIRSFDHVSAHLNISIGAVNISKYEDRFTVPETVSGLDFVDGDFIRVAVRNDLVELSSVYNESIKDVESDMEEGLEDIVGENVTLSFSWEDRTWEMVPSYREEYPSGLGDLNAYLTLKEAVSINPESLDLPEGADVGEMVRAVLKLNATIEKDVSFNVTENVGTSITVRAPEGIMFENGKKFGERWSRTYTLEKGNNTIPLVLKYDGEVRDVREEKVFVNGTFDMYNLDNMNVTVSVSISSVNIDNYGSDFSIPETVKGLTYVDHKFIRTAVSNEVVKWKDITDEMNSSVDEFEEEIPDIIGDIGFEYSDPGKVSGPIKRIYEVSNFKLNLTTEENGDLEIDHDLIRSIMNSGAVVDFEFPSVEDINENYSLSMRLGTPDFMRLYDHSGELPRQDGYYTIDPAEGFNGTLRSGHEGPKNQSIDFEMKIDLHRIGIETDILKMGYKVDANARLDAEVTVRSVELPMSMQDKLPEEIILEYATADLIREAERNGLFDKQDILNMLRNGEDVEGFDGMNQTLRDALDSEDIGVNIAYAEGTWRDTEDGSEIEPLILVMDSKFVIPVKGSGGNALEIYSTEMGEIDIPSIEGIDTSFKITFPSGVIAEVQEDENVKTGQTDGGKNYIEVSTSGDSNESVTINPTIVITEKLLFSSGVYLHGIPIYVLTIIIISLISLGVIGLVLRLYPIEKAKKKKIIKKGMRDALEEEDDPDRWLEYIPVEEKEKYDITRNTLNEVGLEEELEEMKETAQEDEEVSGSEEEDEFIGFEEDHEEDMEIDEIFEEMEEGIEEQEEEK